MNAAKLVAMKLSVASLGPTAFAREIAAPTERFVAVMVDLDEDDIPTMIALKPRPPRTRRMPMPSMP